MAPPRMRANRNVMTLFRKKLSATVSSAPMAWVRTNQVQSAKQKRGDQEVEGHPRRPDEPEEKIGRGNPAARHLVEQQLQVLQLHHDVELRLAMRPRPEL